MNFYRPKPIFEKELRTEAKLFMFSIFFSFISMSDESKVSSSKNVEEERNSSPEPEGEGKQSLEHYRLNGRKPLPTILYLSVGPIIAQVTGALKGIIGTIWLSMSLGEVALATVSTIGVFDGMSRSFGFFVSSAGASKISQLYGQHQEEEASQVVVDLIRISIIFGIVVPAILSPVSEPLAIWLGAQGEVPHQCYLYMLPINIMTFSTIMFIGLGGCLQGEGRSMFFSILNMGALIFNMCVLDPMLLLGFKTGIWGASFGQAFAEFVPCVIIFVMYFMGKFGVKPSFRQFIKPFSPHTGPSMSVGVSQLIANISGMIPSILVRKFMGLAFKPEEFNDAMAGLNTFVRFVILTFSVIIALNMGFVPAASYAYAAKNYRRWFKLCIHVNWTCFVWNTLTSILCIAAPRQLSMMFGKTEGYLDMSEKMLFVTNVCGFITFARFTGVSMLQSLQKGLTSSILSLFSMLVSLVGFSCLMYFTDKHNGIRILWSYSMSYAFGFIASIVVLLVPCIRIYKMMKEQEKVGSSEEEENELHALDDVDESNKSSEPIIQDLKSSDQKTPSDESSSSSSSSPSSSSTKSKSSSKSKSNSSSSDDDNSDKKDDSEAGEGKFEI